MKKPPALILAAGRGTRLAPLKLGVPKPLAPIRGKPFLEIQLNLLRKYNFRSFIIAISRENAMIKDELKDGWRLGIKIRYSIEKEPHGTAITAFKAMRLLPKQFFIFNGDTIFNFDPIELTRLHARYNADMTLALIFKKQVERYGSVVIDDFGKIIKFQEKGHRGSGLVFAGVMLVEKKSLVRFYKKKARSIEKDIFPHLASEGKLFGMRMQGDFWDIGTPNAYRNFCSKYYRKF